MSREAIGVVRGGESGRSFHVGYDPQSHTVYVLLPGFLGGSWTSIARASDVQAALRQADAWAYRR